MSATPNSQENGQSRIRDTGIGRRRLDGKYGGREGGAKPNLSTGRSQTPDRVLKESKGRGRHQGKRREELLGWRNHKKGGWEDERETEGSRGRHLCRLGRPTTVRKLGGGVLGLAVTLEIQFLGVKLSYRGGP